MKIKCSCGNLVAEGEIIDNQKFICGLDKPNGTIVKDNSKNPLKWKGICPSCQRERDKIKNRAS